LADAFLYLESGAFMKRSALLSAACLLVAASAAAAFAQDGGPYKVLTDKKVGGPGGWDYVYADASNRNLYIPRMGAAGTSRVTVFDLDTLAPVTEFPETAGHGVAVAAGHGFSSSNPVVMWDAKDLKQIKTIAVTGRPDGILADEYNDRIYVLSHAVPNVTVIDAKDGNVLGTFDIGGDPEQAVSDGKGHVYIDIEDKGAIAIVDAKAMKMTGKIELAPKADGCAGLAIDRKHEVLFASCREPHVMAVVSIANGQVLTTLPIGNGSDGATFNPETLEAFSTQGDGTLTVVKESSPTSFAVEQTVATPRGARTLTLDAKTGHILTVTSEFGPTPPPQPGQKYARAPQIPDTFQIVVVGK
jgi:DNA-binding beta-propeller fold protein YncE